MDYRRFGSKLLVRMDPGEEVLEQLKGLCEKEHIALAEVKALGALNAFSVGLFDTGEKRYYSHDYTLPVEVTSLWGTVTTQEGKTYLHLHLSAADRENRVYGGHLNRAVVSATVEMVVDVMDGVVERELSPEVGLNLFKFL